MKKMKYLRSWLTIALVVTIIGSLTGGTVAWFTDSVESKGNIIESGTLDIKLYAGKSSNALTEITNNSNPLFNYNLWEPGYTEIRYLKIENAGNLALKYKFGINPSSVANGANDKADLAEVIDVYVFDANTDVDREVIKAASPVGNLKTLKADGAKIFEGYLLPAKDVGSKDYNEDVTTPRGSVEKVIVLKMRESAGNEYQNCSLNHIGIKLEAAQYAWEKDSFNHEYDAGAEFVQLPSANVSIMPKTALQNLPMSGFGAFTPSTVPENLKGENDTITLDYGMTFSTTETSDDLEGKNYANWHADFVVRSNKDITEADYANGAPLVLLGNYGDFGWVPVAIAMDPNK